MWSVLAAYRTCRSWRPASKVMTVWSNSLRRRLAKACEELVRLGMAAEYSTSASGDSACISISPEILEADLVGELSDYVEHSLSQTASHVAKARLMLALLEAGEGEANKEDEG